MSKKKVILVTGGTGAQGGSVAKALLQNQEFSVRVLTRDPASEKAAALRHMGAEIAVGDMCDQNALVAAMEGCYGVFGITNFWEHFGKEWELGKNLIEAVKMAEIKHFVLHTLPDYKALSNGAFEVPHCDIKAALKAFSQKLQLPATYLQVAFYYENFLNFFPLKQDQYGTYQFGFPQGHTKLAMVSVEDVGAVVSRIFAEPEAYLGRTVTVVGADETCDQYAATMTKALGLPVQYNYIPWELYKSFGFPGAEELANMFEVQRLYIPTRQKEMEESYRLNPNMQTFESWLQKKREHFVVRMQQSKNEEAVC